MQNHNTSVERNTKPPYFLNHYINITFPPIIANAESRLRKAVYPYIQ